MSKTRESKRAARRPVAAASKAEQPFLFYGARSAGFNDGGNYEYVVRFARALTGPERTACESAFRRALADSDVVDTEDTAWVWGRGGWASFAVGDYFDWSGGHHGISRAAFIELADAVAAALRKLHERFAIAEAQSLCLDGYDDDDAWTKASLDRQPDPSEPPAFPRAASEKPPVVRRTPIGKRADELAALAERDFAAGEQAALAAAEQIRAGNDDLPVEMNRLHAAACGILARSSRDEALEALLDAFYLERFSPGRPAKQALGCSPRPDVVARLAARCDDWLRNDRLQSAVPHAMDVFAARREAAAVPILLELAAATGPGGRHESLHIERRVLDALSHFDEPRARAAVVAGFHRHAHYAAEEYYRQQFFWTMRAAILARFPVEQAFDLLWPPEEPPAGSPAFWRGSRISSALDPALRELERSGRGDPRWLELALAALERRDPDFNQNTAQRIVAACPHPRKSALLLDAVLGGLEPTPRMIPFLAEGRDRRALAVLERHTDDGPPAMLAAVAAALLAFDEPAATASARTALLRAIELARDPDDVAAVAPSVRRLAGADLTAALRATATRIRKLDVKGAEATRRKNEAARALLVLANAAPP